MIPTLTLNPALDLFFTEGGYGHGELARSSANTAAAGGKGINVAREVTRLGADTRAFCLLGGFMGKRIAAMLRAEGIPFTAAWQRGETRVNVHFRAGSDEWKLNAAGPTPEPGAVKEIVAKFEKRLKPGVAAVVAGSLPDGVSMRVATDLLRRGRSAGARMWFDADGELLKCGLGASPWGIKPNRQEFAELTKCFSAVSSLDEIVAAARGLIAQHGLNEILLTLDKDGAMSITATEVHRHRPSKSDTRRHIVGAGDKFLAAWLVAETRGIAGSDALAFASGAVEETFGENGWTWGDNE